MGKGKRRPKPKREGGKTKDDEVVSFLPINGTPDGSPPQAKETFIPRLSGSKQMARPPSSRIEEAPARKKQKKQKAATP